MEEYTEQEYIEDDKIYDDDEDIKMIHRWTEEFPSDGSIKNHTPVRISVVEYDDLKMVFSKTNKKLEPEVRHSPETTQCCIPRLYPPIFGYPVMIQNQMLTMTRNMKTLTDLRRLLDDILTSKRMWAHRDMKIEPIKNEKIISCYKTTPIHAFNSISIEEADPLLETDSIWRKLYDTQITFTRHPGLYGTLHDNSLIDVRPYEDDDELGSFSVELRKSKQEWLGFIDCTYTPGSVEAGRIRSLVHMVRYRSMSPYTIQCALDLLECCIPDDPRSEVWTFFMLGYTKMISERNVRDMIERWLGQYGPNAPSLHVFESKKVVTISISPGCLVRPLSVVDISSNFNPDQHKWIDSVIYHNQTMLQSYGFLYEMNQSPLEYMRTFCHLVPYILWDEPPRPLLAGSMSTQAICRPRVELFSTIRPKHSIPPIVRTPLIDEYVHNIQKYQHIDIPGVELLTLFCNSKHNYEDSVILSDYVNKYELFAHVSMINHPVPNGIKRMNAGDKITPEDKWWRPAQNATVIKEGFSKTKTRYVSAMMESSYVNVGDKIGTQHGQKFTVSEILPHDKMPLCIDTKSGRKFRPHIIVASSSVHNRITLGQIFEAHIAMDVIQDLNFNPLEISDYVVTSSEGYEVMNRTEYTCNIEVDDMEIFHPNGEFKIECDYGICRYWLLAHLSRDKQHYLSHVPRGPTVPRGRLHGSSVRLGEMEIHVMLMNGLINVLAELTQSADMVIVNICVGCRRLALLCDCDELQSTTEIITRISTVKFDICRAIYTIHGSDIDPEIFNAGSEMIPSSFTYHV